MVSYVVLLWCVNWVLRSSVYVLRYQKRRIILSRNMDAISGGIFFNELIRRDASD